MTIQAFDQKYTMATMRMSTGKDFTYRYHRNDKANATLVLLAGGIGL